MTGKVLGGEDVLCRENSRCKCREALALAAWLLMGMLCSPSDKFITEQIQSELW